MVDYRQLSNLFKEFFPVHNIFQRNPIEYLKGLDEPFVIEKDGEIRAAAYLIKLYDNEDHTRWKFRHFAWKNEEDALELLDIMESKIKDESKTAKIELTITENEQGLEFYERNGYKIEGRLSNHYRMNETCFILGKTIE